MRRFLCTLIIIGSSCLGLSAAAEKIYKWVDQQGVTHYSEQGPTDENAVTIKIKDHQVERKTQQTEPAEIGNDIQPPDIKPEPEIDAALSKQQLAVQQQNCVTARNKLLALKNAGRVRQLDTASGEYTYLAEEVKLAQIQQMSDYLRDKCRR